MRFLDGFLAENPFLAVFEGLGGWVFREFAACDRGASMLSDLRPDPGCKNCQKLTILDQFHAYFTSGIWGL